MLEIVFAIVLHRARHWTVPLAIVNTVLALAFAIPAMILLLVGRRHEPRLRRAPRPHRLSSARAASSRSSWSSSTGVLAAADIIDGFVKAIRGAGSWPELPDLEDLAHLGELGNLRKLRRR